MPLIIVFGALILLAAIFGPQYWVKHVIKKHSVHRDDFPGTGGELARHLIQRFELVGVGVEMSEIGDHYDPEARMVRLSQDNYNGSSLSAVAIATHEVGHAIQHYAGDGFLKTRTSFAKVAMVTDRFAYFFFAVAPLAALVSRSPGFFALLAIIGFALLAVRVVAQVVSLPNEFDASFNKALPILEEGDYLKPEDMPAARSVLKAAAYTYVAAALVSLIDILRFLRR